MSRSTKKGPFIDEKLWKKVEKLDKAGIKTVQAIGDCAVPSIIAVAVHDGHRAAREMDAPPADPDQPFRREYIALADAV